jgi:hypothetical protein
MFPYEVSCEVGLGLAQIMAEILTALMSEDTERRSVVSRHTNASSSFTSLHHNSVILCMDAVSRLHQMNMLLLKDKLSCLNRWVQVAWVHTMLNFLALTLDTTLLHCVHLSISIQHGTYQVRTYHHLSTILTIPLVSHKISIHSLLSLLYWQQLVPHCFGLFLNVLKNYVEILTK